MQKSKATKSSHFDYKKIMCKLMNINWIFGNIAIQVETFGNVGMG